MGWADPPPPSTPLFVVMLKGQCHEIHTIGMRFSLTDLECGVVAAGEEDAGRGGFVGGAADAGGEGVAVGEGFAVNGQVGRVSEN